MNPADEMAAKVVLPSERRLAGAAAGSGEKSDPQLRAILENLEGVARQDDRHSGKRRGSRGFVRFLVAICIGVGGTLAWQSYGEAIKQIIATRAPELGWSPEAKQTIASSIQWLGWTRQPAHPENAAVAPKAPAAPSFDPARMQEMVQNLAVLREMVQQLTAGQDQTTREIAKVESAVVEILMKVPEPPQPPAAPARKPAPVPSPSSRVPTAQPSSRLPQ
jgi:hypothetical protein